MKGVFKGERREYHDCRCVTLHIREARRLRELNV